MKKPQNPTKLKKIWIRYLPVKRACVALAFS